MKEFSDTAQPIARIKIRALQVRWPDAQRQVTEKVYFKRAKDIADQFDPDLFGVISVSPVEAGVYHVNDGWTRVLAAKILYGDEASVPCIITQASTKKRAAESFLGQFSRYGQTPYSRFVVAVTAGREPETSVKSVADRLGYKFSQHDSSNSITAVSTCIRIAKRYGIDILYEVLQTVHVTWGLVPGAVEAAILEGYALLLNIYSEKVDRPKLVQKISKEYTPTRLLGAARAGRAMFGGNLPRAVCQIIIQTYNYRLQAATQLSDSYQPRKLNKRSRAKTSRNPTKTAGLLNVGNGEQGSQRPA